MRSIKFALAHFVGALIVPLAAQAKSDLQD
jgi:hypothetical protein